MNIQKPEFKIDIAASQLKPDEFIQARHIAVPGPNLSEDRLSDAARGWIGTIESYTFLAKTGNTELTAEVQTNPKWEKMCIDGWPKALARLKEICGS